MLKASSFGVHSAWELAQTVLWNKRDRYFVCHLNLVCITF